MTTTHIVVSRVLLCLLQESPICLNAIYNKGVILQLGSNITALSKLFVHEVTVMTNINWYTVLQLLYQSMCRGVVVQQRLVDTGAGYFSSEALSAVADYQCVLVENAVCMDNTCMIGSDLICSA